MSINYAQMAGVGARVVMLHGGSARWQYHQEAMNLLASRWHVYAPDFRGHGKSSWARGLYRVQDYVDDTIVFLEGCVGEAALLFGHSLGGVVAMMLAAQRPDLVRAVIFGDPPFDRERLRDHIQRNRPMTAYWRELAGSERSVEDIARALKDTPVLDSSSRTDFVRAGDAFGENNGWFSYMAETLKQHDPAMLTSILDHFDEAWAGYDVEKLLPRIQCPALILQGDPACGGLLSDSEVSRALALLPHGKHHRFEGIGHELHGRYPTQVMAVVSEFLEQVD